MIKKKHTNNNKKKFAFFVSSLAALPEADATLPTDRYARDTINRDGSLSSKNSSKFPYVLFIVLCIIYVHPGNCIIQMPGSITLKSITSFDKPKVLYKKS